MAKSPFDTAVQTVCHNIARVVRLPCFLAVSACGARGGRGKLISISAPGIMEGLSTVEAQQVETQHWIWATVAAVAGLAGGFLYWRHRRRRRSRLISIVALLREPVTFDPAVLARLAGKAWNADLGDGTSEGSDGFLAGAEISSMILYGGRMHLINSFPSPYVEDPEKIAEGIPDMRLRSLFREHQAWFSCDALGLDHTTSDEEVCAWYQRLGKLFAELLDENCMLILVPDTDRAYPINEDTEAALRSDNPLAALQETLTVPMIEVPPDDPLMKEAVEKARQGWPAFVEAYEAGAGESFSVKAPVTHGDNTEFIWIAVTSLEGERIYGTLGNDPVDLGPLTLGSKVSVPVAELNDWMFIDRQGNMTGGFTVAAVQKAAQRHRG
jgi:uncharacterized protein YegJ (DUF2314 family)